MKKLTGLFDLLLVWLEFGLEAFDLLLHAFAFLFFLDGLKVELLDGSFVPAQLFGGFLVPFLLKLYLDFQVAYLEN